MALNASGHDPWQQLIADLRAWHLSGSTACARAAIAFLEPELRLSVPPLVRRAWPAEEVDDLLADFLARLLERPLPTEVVDPAPYLRRSFRNRCIDHHRSRQRRAKLQPADQEWDVPRAPEEPGIDGETLQAGLADLEIPDRVALKLVEAPEWLLPPELEWLAALAGTDPMTVAARVGAARSVHDLTEIFDPPRSDVPDDRRHRMERFRKRRARAAGKLRSWLTGRRGEL